MELKRNAFGYLEAIPKPSREELAAYYNDKYFNNDAAENSYQATYTDEEIVHKEADAAECAYFSTSAHKTLLDIGCGEGFFLDCFQKRGFTVRGLDFTTDGVRRFFPQLLDKVATGDLYDLVDTEIASGRKYDVVTCNNVLEHVIDPERMAASLCGLLAPDGICRLQVPNDDSFMNRDIVRREMAVKEFFKATPDHLNYFNFDTFAALARRSGFKVQAALGSFPIGFYLYNVDCNYRLDRSKGKKCHYARVAIDCMLYRESVEKLVEFRKGCGAVGLGNDVTLYCSADLK
jgi:2-polyprenyl-3-methyl-5-hydroxy-6-metoxy-1,4-benzoquinol methylase